MAKRANRKEWEAHEKFIKDHKEDGYKEKKDSIDKLTHKLEQLEKSLIAAGGKTFQQLYPDITNPTSDRYTYNNEPPKPTPYATNIRFQVPDLSPIKKAGYVRLFEAVWANDLETVKSLTMAPWSSEGEKTPIMPLKIAVKDGNGFSPFSIAVLRGHHDLARKIIGICLAQLDEGDENRPRQRWTLNPPDSDEESCYSDESEIEKDDENVLPIYNELISDKYTIDNLGQVATVVKSDVGPLTMIEWPCHTQRFIDPAEEDDTQYTILGHAIVTNDMELFKFILQLGAEQHKLRADEDDDQKCYTVPKDIFHEAIKRGRTAMLAEMVCSPQT